MPIPENHFCLYSLKNDIRHIFYLYINSHAIYTKGKSEKSVPLKPSPHLSPVDLSVFLITGKEKKFCSMVSSANGIFQGPQKLSVKDLVNRLCHLSSILEVS